MLGLEAGFLGEEAGVLGLETAFLGEETRLLGLETAFLGEETRFLGVEPGLLGEETRLLGVVAGLLRAPAARWHQRSFRHRSHSRNTAEPIASATRAGGRRADPDG